MRILFIKINLANIVNYDQFTRSAQFDVKESKTYFRAIKGFYSAKWIKSIIEKLN